MAYEYLFSQSEVWLKTTAEHKSLAKANAGQYLYPPAKAGGNSDKKVFIQIIRL